MPRSKRPDDMDDLFGGIPKALYDGLPYVTGSETSKAAAESMMKDAGRCRRLVYEAIARSPDGLTCDEVEVITGLIHQNASARCRELKLGKHIHETGAKRPTRSGRMADILKKGPPPP